MQANTLTAERLHALAELYQQGHVSGLKYHRSSTEFYQQFQAGQTGDEMDYVEWASLVQMADNLKKRLRLLSGEAEA